MKRFEIGLAVVAVLLFAAPSWADVPAGKTMLIAHHTWNPAAVNPHTPPNSVEPAFAPCGRAGCDFRYMVTDHMTPVCGHTGPICDHFAQPDFDTSTWSTGRTPFGDIAAYPIGFCAMFDTDGISPWAHEHDLMMRAELNLCAGVTGMEIHVAIDNSIGIWVNGTRLSDAAYPAGDRIAGSCYITPDWPTGSPEGLCNNEYCTSYDSLKYLVPDGLLHSGKNVIAFQACDHGIVSLFDFDVVADITDEVCDDPCDDAVATLTELWPPNHKMVPVSIWVGEGANARLATITSVRQDEPVKKNNGDKCPDAVISTDGLSVQLRAERLGKPIDPGRIYHLGYAVDGVACEEEITLCVPHDQGNHQNCYDAGPLVNSTVCP